MKFKLIWAATYQISGFFYLPRQDSNWNGTIKNFVFYVSRDGKEWTEVASGGFTRTKDEQFVGFTPVAARYVSLVSLSEVNGGGGATIAGINILGD